jgi:adhesin transport system outer membrane protein
MLLKTTEVYLGVIRAQEVVKLADENVKEHDSMLKKVQDMAAGGKGNYGDVSQAQSRLAQAKERRIRILGQLEDAKTNYKEIVGIIPEDLMTPSVDQIELPMLVSEAQTLAVENSPRMISVKNDSQAQGADVKVEQASFYPTLSLDLSSNNDWDANGFEEKTVDNRAMLVLNFNLFNGGENNARRLQAIELSVEANQKMHQTRREIEKLTGIDFQAYLTAKDSLVWLKEREKASLNALKNYQEQFRLGKRSLLDVLDVTNELFQSKVTVLDGKLALDFSKYKVLADMGQLTSTLSVTEGM